MPESNVHHLPTVTQPGGGLRKPLRPPERVKAEWKAEGKRLGQRGYLQRWSTFWGRVVRACASYGPVAQVDVTLVEEYVRRCRLAEAHLISAMAEPYTRMDSGFVQAHPGFAQSRAESKAATEASKALGLTPQARRAAGILPPVAQPDEEPDSAEGDAPAWDDDQRDPDGRAL